MEIQDFVPRKHRADVLKLLEASSYKRHIIDWQFERFSESAPIIATDERGVVGFNGIMPMQVCLRGDIVDAQWTCDFFVDPIARRQGVGKALKKKLDEKYQLILALGVSEVGQKVLHHTGWTKLAGPRRYIRIINADSLRRRAICLLQRSVSGLFGRDDDDELSIKIAPIAELPPAAEINELCNQVIRDYSACVVRNWKYLNWRYTRCPVGRYSIMLVRNPDELVALAIISHHGRDMNLVDYLGPRKAPKIKNRIVRRLLDFGSESGKIDCTTSDRGFALELMRNGFLSRRSSDVAFFIRYHDLAADQVETDWFLTDGDSDADVIRCAQEEWRST